MERYLSIINSITDEVKKVVVGKDDIVDKVMMAILAGGHILIDDIPGVGKTTLAIAFSKAMSLKQNRIQFTPDVMPADITGFSMYNSKTGEFEYKPGAVMCNLFLADEINRTSSKTQSALLEVMEERQVSVDGQAYSVPNPFIVMATQNPVGSIGTQMLPESQLDRFAICISMGYPDIKNEVLLMKNRQNKAPLNSVKAIIRSEDLRTLQSITEQIYIDDAVLTYIATIADRTRKHPFVELGISPRGSLMVAKIAKASAFMNGRNYVIPKDVQRIFADVSGHRMILNSKAKLNDATMETVIAYILQSVAVPKIA